MKDGKPPRSIKLILNLGKGLTERPKIQILSKLLKLPLQRSHLSKTPLRPTLDMSHMIPEDENFANLWVKEHGTLEEVMKNIIIMTLGKWYSSKFKRKDLESHLLHVFC